MLVKPTEHKCGTEASERRTGSIGGFGNGRGMVCHLVDEFGGQEKWGWKLDFSRLRRQFFWGRVWLDGGDEEVEDSECLNSS